MLRLVERGRTARGGVSEDRCSRQDNRTRFEREGERERESQVWHGGEKRAGAAGLSSYRRRANEPGVDGVSVGPRQAVCASRRLWTVRGAR